MVIYLDDIMIDSCTLAEHPVHVRALLNLLTELGLNDNCAKCVWLCQKVDVSGFDINKDGIDAQEDNTHAAMHWP